MAEGCTGLTARWCAVHGDCTCPAGDSHLDSQWCPLHSPESDHAEEAERKAALVGFARDLGFRPSVLYGEATDG